MVNSSTGESRCDWLGLARRCSWGFLGGFFAGGGGLYQFLAPRFKNFLVFFSDFFAGAGLLLFPDTGAFSPSACSAWDSS